MQVKLKAQKQNALSDEEMQEATQHVADYIEQLCNLPYCFNRDGHWFSTCTCLKGFKFEDPFLYSISTMLCKFFISLPFFSYYLANLIPSFFLFS
jgi:hypothetical protein